MYLIIKLNFSNQDTIMEHLLKYHNNKESIYFQIIMWREMLGIIGFMHLMILKD